MEKNNLKYERFYGGVKVVSGTAYIVYIIMGGSGITYTPISCTTWYEGPDELVAVCESEDEAKNTIEEFMKKM